MKYVSMVLFIVMVSLTSCAVNQEKEIAEERKPSSFQPEPLDDEWSKWLMGKWEGGHSDYHADESEGPGESNTEGGAGFTIESVLNGQYLLWKSSWAETDQITDEEKKQLKEAFKETINASDDDLERLLSMPYKSMQIQTIDLKTGERIAYCFDSMRCIGKGTGRLEGNKEIMEWEWSGILQGATSVSIMEKISDNKFTSTHIITMPDGNIMEEKIEMIRKKIKAKK